METLTVILSLFTLAAVAVLLLVVLRQRHQPREPDPSLLLLQQQLHALQQRLDAFGETVATSLRESTHQMNSRLDNAARVVGDLREQVGQVQEIGRAAAELVNILRAPKLRGGLGELILADLLTQILPPEHYRLQHRFKSGETVDATIAIGSRLVPVDAKFPYENFKRVLAAAADAERAAARKQFLRDVRKHVDAIAGKYIRPDEDTYDFALMYVPAENVYYETIIKADPDDEHELFGYCLARRVIPVSPNSFYAYLQTILLGLRGLKVEQSAREILDTLGRLRGDFEKLQENIRLLGRHLNNAAGSFAETEKALTRFDAKLSQIETPPALPEAKP